MNSLSGDKAELRKEMRLHKQFEFILSSLKPILFFCCICQTAVLKSTALTCSHPPFSHTDGPRNLG